MSATYLEEQALHAAALAYARARHQPLETRMRIDRAREVLRLVSEWDAAGTRDDLDAVVELALLTLLHAGEKDFGEQPPKPVEKTRVELLVEAVRAEVDSVKGSYAHPDQLEGVVFAAFDRIAALVKP